MTGTIDASADRGLPACPLSVSDAEQFLYREAHYLDDRQWDAWLDLFTTDARFWVPSWIEFDRPASDPDRELSLIFLAGRDRLAERIWRLRSGRSVASAPLSRTMHQITNIQVEGGADGTAVVRSNVAVHVYGPRRREPTLFFGRYRHLLRDEGGWRIAEKKVLLLNDFLPSFLDVYTI